MITGVMPTNEAILPPDLPPLEGKELDEGSKGINKDSTACSISSLEVFMVNRNFKGNEMQLDTFVPNRRSPK